jgi:heme/copper-type cytochrome/quinol oxidase subunit 2
VVFLSPSRKLPVLHLNQSAILNSDSIVKSTKEKKFMLVVMMMIMMMTTTVMIVIPFFSYCMLSARSSRCRFIKLTSMEDFSHSHLLPTHFIVRTEDAHKHGAENNILA